MERLLVVSSSPHIHSPLDTQKVMGWVLAALAPAGLAGVYFFLPRRDCDGGLRRLVRAF